MFQKIFLGSNPRTSIAGILLAALYALQIAVKAAPSHWYDVAIAVLIAVLGRVAGDSANSQC